MISGGGLWWYYKWYHSLSSKILPHFYVNNILLPQKLTKLEQFIENHSKFQKEINQNLNKTFLIILWSILDPFTYTLQSTCFTQFISILLYQIIIYCYAWKNVWVVLTKFCYFFLNKLFICFILILYTEFQSPTMPGTCQKVCVDGCKPILVFSFGQAEQYQILGDPERCHNPLD